MAELEDDSEASALRKMLEHKRIEDDRMRQQAQSEVRVNFFVILYMIFQILHNNYILHFGLQNIF